MAVADLRVVHLASYASAYSGSFIPMLEAARTGIESRGWTYEAVFPPGVERFVWYEKMQNAGVDVRTWPGLGKRGGDARWIRDLLGERPGSTLLHTHFSAWDVPAAIAACPRRDAKVIWHLHSRMLEDAVPRARNAVRFALLGRTVARILCVGARDSRAGDREAGARRPDAGAGQRNRRGPVRAPCARRSPGRP